MTNLRTSATWLHSLGANVLAVGDGKNPIHTWAGGKDGTGPDWTKNRQAPDDVSGFPWERARALGAINGPGGFHTFDIDARKDEQHNPIAVVTDAAVDALLAALGLSADYAWVWRSKSRAGWALAFQCTEVLPLGVLPAAKKEAGVFWGWPARDSAADWHHLELRWVNNQTIYPACDSDQWRHGAPTEAPAEVSVTRVINAFFTLAPPPPHTLGSIDDSTKETIRHRFDMVEYARQTFGGDVQRDGREYRILGHGGLLVDPEKGVWNNFSDEIGGDCFDLIAYAKYRTRAQNLNGKSAEVLRLAADFAGVRIPERVVEQHPAAPAEPHPAPAFRLEIATEDELMALPPIRYLDRELGMMAGGYHLIYGASGSGKTFFGIERAMRQVSLGKRVLYIATEDKQGLRYRVAAWRLAHPGASGRLTWLRMPDGLDLQNHAHVGALLDTIEPYDYDLIVLDTLREAHSGDENSSQDTARLNRAIQRIAATGAAVDVIHHSGVAGERPRGSTALFGNADVVIKVENDDGYIRIGYDKLRNAPPRDGLTFGLVSQDTGLTDDDDEPVVSAIIRPASMVTRRDAPMTANQRKVLETLALSIFADVGAKERQVTDTAQLNARTVYRALSWLKDKGYVSQGEKGDPYYITRAGRAQLGPELRTTDTTDTAPVSPTDTTDTALTDTDTAGADIQLSLTDTDTTLTGVSVSQLVSVSQSAASEASGGTPTGISARIGLGRSRRAELVDAYERLIGPLSATLTLDELEAAVSAATQPAYSDES